MVSAKIAKLETPIRRRKRSIFPETPWIGEPPSPRRDEQLQIRVTANTKQQLSWLATRRGEPLGAMLGIYLRNLSDIVEDLRRQLKDAPDRPLYIGSTIEIADIVSQFPRQEFFAQARSRIPDVHLAVKFNVLEKLARLHGGYFFGTGRVDLEEIMGRLEPSLGCSINQAITERRYGDIKRLIRSWERQARSLKK
jgi:hypothetical protein